MSSFLKILNLALSSPLYLNTKMFIPLKENPEKVPTFNYDGIPPEFNFYGKRGSFYYRYFSEPERFYRGLIVDMRI